MYNITPNNYVKPTEVRPEVVQMLIDFFMDRKGETFCPNRCWRRTHSIGISRYGRVELIGHCTSCPNEYKNVYLIRTCEMKEFVRVWLENGYYMSKGSYSVNGRTAILYKFTDKPFNDCGYRNVTKFDEDID